LNFEPRGVKPRLWNKQKRFEGNSLEMKHTFMKSKHIEPNLK